MIIDTLGPDGPWCPMCQTSVENEGEFDTSDCWEVFHLTVQELGVTLIDMDYIELERQPWYGQTT
jgi:hypothetical protein